MSNFVAITNIQDDSIFAIYIDSKEEHFSALSVKAWALKTTGEAEALVLKNNNKNSGLTVARLGREQTFGFVGLLNSSQLRDAASYMQFCEGQYPRARKIIEDKLAEPTMDENQRFISNARKIRIEILS